MHEKNHYLLINSADRNSLSSSTSNFTIDLPRHYNNVRRVRLLSYTVSNTIYTINDRNDQLIFSEDAGGGNVTVSLTHGIYSGTTLSTHIASLLTSNSVNGYTYAGSYSTSTLKMTFSTTANYTFHFTNSTSPYRAMGWNDQDEPSSSTSLTSPNVIRLDTNNILMQTNLNNEIRTTNGVNGQFLLNLPASGSTHTVYINNTFEIDRKVQARVYQIDITLRDLDKNIVDFNGSDSNFLFELSTSED